MLAGLAKVAVDMILFAIYELRADTGKEAKHRMGERE